MTTEEEIQQLARELELKASNDKAELLRYQNDPEIRGRIELLRTHELLAEVMK